MGENASTSKDYSELMANVCRTWRSRWSQVQDLSGLPCWGGHELCWQYRSRLLVMLMVLMCSCCWSWFLPGWGGRELCWQYRSRILRSFFKMLILIIDYCRMRSWTVLTIQVHVIVHDADADVFIMLIMILDRNNSYNITNNCEYCPGPSLTVSHNIAKP